MTNEELVKRIQAGEGGQEEILELWNRNRRLLQKLCRRYLPETEQEDALQESYFGVIEAVKRYRPEMNMVFSSYMHLWVRAVLLRYRTKTGRAVHLPGYQAERLRKIRRIRDRYKMENGTEPDTKTLSTLSGMTAAEVERLRVIEITAAQCASLDKPLSPEGMESVTLGDILPGDETTDAEPLENLEQEEVSQALREWVRTVDGGEILERHHIDGLSLERIGAEAGKTTAEIRRQAQKAMQELRNPRKQREILPYLPERLQSAAYRSGLKTFRFTGTSSTEAVAMALLEDHM